ncbi:MAG: Serine/threonine-protein kinase pkn1 [Planctomycetota bacterium]|jgi:formylglycine-generating enzyme required for sulfatase activity
MSGRFVIVIFTALVLAVALEQARTQPPAPASSVSPLLKAFVDECVPITPGKSPDFPAGPVRLGVPNPQDQLPEVTITLDKAFRISKYEVTQELWELVMGSNPSRWKGPRNSVEMMTFQQANQFCERLTSQLRQAGLIADTEHVRLPTEAEWEYCCRAGTTTQYSFGDSATAEGDADNKASILDKYGWHTGNAAGNDPPVGALKPNPWGLYDMHGYLWEFVTADARLKDVTGKDSKAAASAILRSGSWKDKHPSLTSSSRRLIAADVADDAIGLRCVIADHQE